MGCSGAKGATNPSKQSNPSTDKKQSDGEKKDDALGAKKSDGKNSATLQKDESITFSNVGDKKPIMEKYKMSMDKGDIMGEGTSSICRRGTQRDNGEEVAIKVYKEQAKATGKQKEVTLYKFKRQVKVLVELQEPFVPASDPALWQEQLANVKPSRIFMRCLDYSKDKDGNPGYDSADNILYVVTELAQYSLKDFLAQRRDQAKPLSAESVKNMCKAVVTAMAGLHAKGFVHLDMKPENLMMFNGRLKLIDVDGCVKINSNVSITDSSISFSPCYCAPEWAEFLINESNSGINVVPALDVWSVGMTICEFVTLNAVLKPMYGNFLRNAHSHREAGFLFMDWLSNIRKVPLPKNIEKFDPEFFDLIQNWLLVCDKGKRKSCAQAMSHPYVASAMKSSKEIKAEDMDMTEKDVARTNRIRGEDTSNTAPLYKGTLWKLNTNGDAKDNAHWLKRDMWIAAQGSLCYFSVKENKRLVLVDGAKLADATVTTFPGGAKENAFEIKYKGEDDDKLETLVFACETAEEYKNWTTRMASAIRMDMPTMQLGAEIADLRKFIITVKNRRQKIEEGEKDQFAPVYKANLWKLKAEGDRKSPDDWFEREMWIAKNGSLVYFSKKEDRDLVYYTSADLLRASYTKLPAADSHKPFTFLVNLPKSGDVEFTPGEFAAETDALREQWLKEFKIFSAGGGK